jgi:uncharacterized protein
LFDYKLKMQILITGGTGLVGKALTASLLNEGHSVTILSRNPIKSDSPNLHFAQWNVDKQTIDLQAIQAADIIIHLAGAGVADKRWTEKRKQEIIDSRVQSGNLLFNTLKNNTHKVKQIISASAIGYYGPDRTNHIFTETDQPHTDYLGSTCVAWEKSIEQCFSTLNIPTVILRIGIVLSPKGGALKEFLKPIKFGIAPIFASGKQVISWISITDLVSMFIYSMQQNLHGTYNACAPTPLVQKEFINQLAKTAKGKFYLSIPVPAFVLKIMLGEMSIEILKSATVSSKKIQAAGYQFHHQTANQAFTALLAK